MLTPSNTVLVVESCARTALKLLDSLEDLDDVQSVSSNFEMSDAVMEAVAAE
jgi:transcriptional/translational regulatory protein YebC/TACO1